VNVPVTLVTTVIQSPPPNWIYRYFASRDELLAALVAESYDLMAEALETAAEQSKRRAPEGRLRAVLDAYRTWAVANPHRYRLTFGSAYGSGELDPDRIISAAQRAMVVLLVALSDLDPDRPGPAVADAALRRQLADWQRNRSPELELDPGIAALGIAAWTRIHGIVSLEIEGFFTQVGVDPARLYQAEIDHLINQRMSA
jgi:AcrR family transcriptional regulator